MVVGAGSPGEHCGHALADDGVIAIPVVFTLMFTYLFGGALAGSRPVSTSS